jgi:hypothetical protein
MISEGDILLFRFPKSDLGVGKLGTLPTEWFEGIRTRLGDWIRSEESIQSQ